jgi:hypothetical protein
MAQRNSFGDPVLTAIMVSLFTWVAGAFLFSVDETIRQVAIHMPGIGN